MGLVVFIFNTGGVEPAVLLAASLGGTGVIELCIGLPMAVDTVARHALAMECAVAEGGCVRADDPDQHAWRAVVF